MQLLPVITQHISLFQKNAVKYLTGTNHNFPEVNGNLPLPRHTLNCILVRLGYGWSCPYARHALCNSNLLTSTESLLLSCLVPESASKFPALMEGDGGQILSPSYMSLLVPINYKNHTLRLQQSDSSGKRRRNSSSHTAKSL